MPTFSGAGFGTLLVQLSAGPRETPPVASNRAYLRAGLPAVYQDGDFGMRFIGALETLLDPIVAILDALPAHFSPDHAPRDILALLSAWLGVELVESQTVEQRRDALRHAAELSRRRGTRAGLELALRLAFPKLSMRVEDSGGVLVAPPPADAAAAAGVVRRLLQPVHPGEHAGGGGPLHRAEQARARHLPAAGQGGAEGRRMRTCPSCGLENPLDRDFCQCGEYLRWEPTGIQQAIAPPAPAAAPPPAAEPAAPEPAAAPPPRPAGSGPAPPPAARAAAPPPPPPPPPRRQRPAAPAAGDGREPLPPTPPPPARTEVRQPAVAASQEPEGTTLTLRLPDEEPQRDEGPMAIGVHPGSRVRVLAMVRNQSGIVDNYQLSVEGMPDDWWSIHPDMVYLTPFGSSGAYEQEVEVHLHPPRAPEAEARIWPLTIVVHSRAHDRTAATEPVMLGIQPFEEHSTTLKPERASGRRKAEFDVGVKNTANAPVLLAFEGTRPRQRVHLPLQARGRRHRARREAREQDGRAAAEADLDRPPARAPARGQRQERRRGGRHPGRGGRPQGRRRRRRQARAGRHPGHVRPQDRQGEDLRARRQHRPGRDPGPPAAVPRAAGPRPADEAGQPQPARPQDARRAGAARRPGAA